MAGEGAGPRGDLGDVVLTELDGKIEGLAIRSTGPQLHNSVIEALTQQFGAPIRKEEVTYQTANGTTWKGPFLQRKKLRATVTLEYFGTLRQQWGKISVLSDALSKQQRKATLSKEKL